MDNLIDELHADDLGDGPATVGKDRAKILVVDDDEVLLRSLKRILKARYDVQCESNPYRALVALEDDGPFAVIVSDLTMPGVDGIEFLERARDEAPETPRILLTGNATLPASIDAVNRAHIDSFLTKPVSPEELLRWIDNAVLQHGELVNEFDTGSEILEGSAAALMETLAIANPTAYALTKRVTNLSEHYLKQHPRSDAWEISMAARLCYLGSAALGADLSSRVLHGEPVASSEDLLVGCVAGFTIDIVARIPRLAHVEDILRHHRSRPARADVDGMPFGAQLLGALTALAEFEATTNSRQDAADALMGLDAFEPDLVAEILDLYLPVGDPALDHVVDLTETTERQD
ncbi:MAG: response regulator [Acidimicrobiales bacterium]